MKTSELHEKVSGIPKNNRKPVHKFTQKIVDSKDPGYVNRVMVATPTTGLVRMEWVAARYGQVVPVNWSMVQAIQAMSSYIPLRYSVADAQNLIVKQAIEKDFQWLLLIEHDTAPPEDAFVRFNNWMQREDVPVVSGLYYTRSQPSEPLVFRGRGNGVYDKWKLGDRVWCDGVPTGMLLISVKLLKAMWADSPEYVVNNIKTRRVFETPVKQWFNEEEGRYNTITGTSDLDWCTKVIEGGYFKKAGWPDIQNKKYPFLVDTRIACCHISSDGTQYPYPGFYYKEDPNEKV